MRNGVPLNKTDIPFLPATELSRLIELKQAGAILLGKTNLTEFAIGGSIRFPAACRLGSRLAGGLEGLNLAF